MPPTNEAWLKDENILRDLEQKLAELNANLLVRKDLLRRTEGFLRDCLLAAQMPESEIAPEEYLDIAKALEGDIIELRLEIEKFEAERTRILNMIKQYSQS